MLGTTVITDTGATARCCSGVGHVRKPRPGIERSAQKPATVEQRSFVQSDLFSESSPARAQQHGPSFETPHQQRIIMLDELPLPHSGLHRVQPLAKPPTDGTAMALVELHRSVPKILSTGQLHYAGKLHECKQNRRTARRQGSR